MATASSARVKTAIDRGTPNWVEDLRGPCEGRLRVYRELRGHVSQAVLLYLDKHRHEWEALPGEDAARLANQLIRRAFQAVVDALDDYQQEARFTTWAYKVAIHEARVGLQQFRQDANTQDRRRWPAARRLGLCASGW
jgi:hypothetical protein